MRDLYYFLQDIKLFLWIGGVVGLWCLFWPYRRY